MFCPCGSITRLTSSERPCRDVTLFLFCPDYSAFLAVTNPCSWSAQMATLLFHTSLTSLVTTHPHIRITLVWTPDNLLLHPQQHTCCMASHTCTIPPPADLHHIHSAVFQKNQARLWAFHQWQTHYNTSLPLCQCGKLPGHFTYTHTLIRPPDGQANHPLWQACMECTPNPEGTPASLPRFTCLLCPGRDVHST